MLFISPDGSYNAFSEEFGEHYSCVSEGACSEKIAKHIAPAFAFLGLDLSANFRADFSHNFNADSKNAKNEVWILDICFGLGYNAILSAILFSKYGIRARIISLECDKHTLKLAQQIHNLDSSILECLRNGTEVMLSQQGIANVITQSTTKSSAKNTITLQIIWGDATENLASLARVYLQGDISTEFGSEFGTFSGFDIIYQDPFSSEKTPQLWTKEHFAHLFSLAKPHCLITTYATKKDIICNAKEAGFLAYKYKADQSADMLHWVLGLQKECLKRQYMQRTHLEHLENTKSFRKSSLFAKIALDFSSIKPA